MADTVHTPRPRRSDASAPKGSGRGRGRAGTSLVVALAFGLLGFMLAAQLRATDGVSERLASEREEDLAQILRELTAQTDRLQAEITDRRLTLAEFEQSAEREELALRSLQQRHDDLRILVGSAAAEGEGVVFLVRDPGGDIGQEELVVAIQELRDAGAEAIVIDGQRLVASSWVSARGGRIVVDGTPIDPPYRFLAVGPAETIATALEIPGGAVDTFERAGDAVTAHVMVRDQLRVPAVSEVPPLVFGRPVTDDG